MTPLHARAAIARAIRAWFHAQGFVEVEPPMIVPAPGGEVHLEAVRAGDAFLHTSPEFAMKRALADGETAIFSLGKVWRAGETGPLHSEEFTMLEWYRAHAPYQAVQEDALAIAQIAAQTAGVARFQHRDCACPVDAPVVRTTVAAAFQEALGFDLLAHQEDRPALAAAAMAAGVAVQADDDAADIFSKLLTQRVEPTLAGRGIVLLDAYPISEAALAQRSPADARVAERFELYICGVEIANGYGELTDAVEQRARFVQTMAERARRGNTPWPIDEAFLAALPHMPPASGCALGFDRLVMLALGAPNIASVQWR